MMMMMMMMMMIIMIVMRQQLHILHVLSSWELPCDAMTLATERASCCIQATSSKGFDQFDSIESISIQRKSVLYIYIYIYRINDQAGVYMCFSAAMKLCTDALH
jgi:hypothetical protein